MLKKSYRIRFIIFIITLFNCSLVFSLEYKFQSGEIYNYTINYGEKFDNFGCQLSVMRTEAASLSEVKVGNVVEDSGKKYHMVFVLSNFSADFKNFPEKKKAYDFAFGRLTNISYSVTMDDNGTIIDTDLADVVNSIEIGDPDLASLVIQNVIYPISGEIWKCLFGKVNSVENGMFYFEEQEWKRLELPVVGRLMRTNRGEGFRYKYTVLEEEQELLLWRDVSEHRAKKFLGYDMDVEVDSKIELFYNQNMGIFVKASHVQKTTILGANEEKSFVGQAFFFAEYIEGCAPKKKANKSGMKNESVLGRESVLGERMAKGSGEGVTPIIK